MGRWIAARDRLGHRQRRAVFLSKIGRPRKPDDRRFRGFAGRDPRGDRCVTADERDQVADCCGLLRIVAEFRANPDIRIGLHRFQRLPARTF
jgi:hypothetical protein